MRVSEYYKLGRTQPYLDFVDVRLDTDIEVFLDPTALKHMSSPWAHECASLLQSFFEAVLKNIKEGNDKKAQNLLGSLNERNEFHLGYSSGKSKGHGFGQGTGETVWEALSKSDAVISGLLQDLEDTSLLIHGIGTDMISDAVCNIIRGPLLQYTQSMCNYYDIPMMPQVASGPIWNPQKESWEHSLVPLPVTDYGPLVLIPKIVVRHRLMYKFDEYYRYYLLPIMQKDELSANTSLVEVLKDGRKRVTKKALMDKYGADKLAVVEQTVKRPEVLDEYKRTKQKKVPLPLSHEDISNIEETELPKWHNVLEQIDKLPTGRETASTYEDLVEKLLTSLFYPSLCSPTKQHEIHDGRKRIDITYTNEPRVGFFAWVAQHYPSSFIFVECKNYGKEVGNPEIDQLGGRFSPNRGKVGILVCRSVENKERLLQRCIDTAQDQRGFIIPLDDDDLHSLVEYQINNPESQEFPILKEKFVALIS